MKLKRFMYVLQLVDDSDNFFRIEKDALRVYLDENTVVVFQGKDMELIRWGQTLLKGRFDRPMQEKSSLMRILKNLNPESEISGDSRHLEVVEAEGRRLFIDDEECRIYDGYRHVATFSRDGINELLNLFY